jgi:hypothetical protein
MTSDPDVCNACGGRADDGVCRKCGSKPCHCMIIDIRGRDWKELERARALSDTQSDSRSKVSEAREAAEQGERPSSDVLTLLTALCWTACMTGHG